jgi:predicted nucleotidyltransferase
MTEKELLSKIEEIAHQVLGFEYRIFLYGSRAKAAHHSFSDFDLLVKGAKPVSPEKWLLLKERVGDLKTLYQIDLVDYHQLDQGFRTIIETQLKEVVNGEIRT